MGEKITLTASDGFELDAWLSKPAGDVKGRIVVIQEIFGVNEHIRDVTDKYADAGYIALAPALFDRAEKDVELGYDMDGIQAGAGIARGKLKPEETMLDTQAAIDYLSKDGPTAIVGYCFGGTVVWSAVCDLENLAAGISYYGGGVPDMIDLAPKCPVIFHFGAEDNGIPLDRVEKLKEAHPDLPVHVYEGADHGFNCDARASHHEEAAKLALERTHVFLDQIMAAA